MLKEPLKISVVMPVYLGNYSFANKGESSSNKDIKFLRAVDSFLQSYYNNKELIVVSDGDYAVENILNRLKMHRLEYFTSCVKFVMVEKQANVARVRNEGLKHVTGDVVCYLDADDVIDRSHLSDIGQKFHTEDIAWAYWNDHLGLPDKKLMLCKGSEKKHVNCYQRPVYLKEGYIGTSCFAHRKSTQFNWEDAPYSEDWLSIHKWLIVPALRYTKIEAGYYVCHFPNIGGRKLDC